MLIIITIIVIIYIPCFFFVLFSSLLTFKTELFRQPRSSQTFLRPTNKQTTRLLLLPQRNHADARRVGAGE
jgi:hypothetical protein